jgi:hypothetical protein
MTFDIWETGAPAISRTELYKKPDQSKYTTEAPRVELSNGFEAVPSTKINTRNQRQTNQEASVRCNMSSGTVRIPVVFSSMFLIYVSKINNMHDLCT